jgi:SAM-dependent methyltransferase
LSKSTKWSHLPTDDYGFIIANNDYGYMIAEPDDLMRAFVSFACKFDTPCVDVGAAFGVASLYAIDQGVKHIIAIDPEQSHLDYIEQQFNTKQQQKGQQIELECGYFPKTINLDNHTVCAILISRVLHFLSGQEITDLLRQAYKILIPGGRIFISTISPYVNLLLDYIETYEENENSDNIEWPGEIDDLRKYLPDSDHKHNQKYGHVLTPKVLSKHLEKAGFKIVTAKFSTRKYQEIAQMTDERYAGKEDTIVIAVK